LKDRITQDMKAALKARDNLTVETCRMLLAAIKNEEINKRHALTDEETIAILNRAVKTRQEAIGLYDKGGRADLADKERREVEIVKRYLPQQLTQEEIARAVQEVVRELGVTSRKEIGRVMKELMARHPGRVDGRLANQIAASLLN